MVDVDLTEVAKELSLRIAQLHLDLAILRAENSALKQALSGQDPNGNSPSARTEA